MSFFYYKVAININLLFISYFAPLYLLVLILFLLYVSINY